MKQIIALFLIISTMALASFKGDILDVLESKRQQALMSIEKTKVLVADDEADKRYIWEIEKEFLQATEDLKLLERKSLFYKEAEFSKKVAEIDTVLIDTIETYTEYKMYYSTDNLF